MSKHHKMSARKRRFLRGVLFRKQGGICAICHLPLSSAKLATLDHIVAVSDGGADTSENLRVVHYDCNYGRHHLLSDEYLRRVANSVGLPPQCSPCSARVGMRVPCGAKVGRVEYFATAEEARSWAEGHYAYPPFIVRERAGVVMGVYTLAHGDPEDVLRAR